MQVCACVKTVLMGINSLWLLLVDGVGEWTVGKMVNTLFCGKEGGRRLNIYLFFLIAKLKVRKRSLSPIPFKDGERRCVIGMVCSIPICS